MIKQTNIPWLGAVIESLYTALPILSIVNFISILIVLYANVYPYIQEYAHWMRFEIFITIVGVVTLITVVAVYKFVVPSIWIFRGKQMFEHESEIVDRLNTLIDKVSKLEKKFEGEDIPN